MSNDKNNLPTVLRGLLILEKVVKARRPVSASELIEQLGLPKPTVSRILQQLEEEAMLQREPENRRYIPGPRARDFVLDVMSNRAIGAPRHAILKTLSEEIGESCICALHDGDHTVYFDHVETTESFRLQTPIGSKLPLHCTASGKIFLAHMDTAPRRRLLKATQLKQFTERTITDPDQLIDQLKTTKDNGFGIDNEEFTSGMVAVAVPIHDATQKVCYTVAVHAPAARKSLQELQQYLPLLRKAAAEMEATYSNPEDQD